MKRFSKVLGGTLGLVSLGVLAVVLALVFGSFREKQTPAISRSPLQSPTPSEPSKTTPSPTITPEESKRVTPVGTLFRSPLATPTVTSTPMPSSTPSPTSSPTPIPTSPVKVVSGPLPPGLKIVCVDKEEDGRTSVIRMAHVDDLLHVQVIAKLENLVDGWSPHGHLSPDGRYVAYVMPRDPQSNSVLGIVSIDGSENRILDEPVSAPGVEWRIRWSPDSQWIAYVRDVVVEREHVKDEIWAIRVDGTEKRSLTSAEYVLLLGWSKDSSHIYYTPSNHLMAVSLNEQSPPFELLRFDKLSSPLGLSPDGDKVIYRATTSATGPSPVTLGVRSLDDRVSYVLAEGIDALGHAYPNYRLSPIWSPDSSRIAYNSLPDEAHTEVLSVRWNAREDVIAVRSREKAYYRPLSWSPDGRFIATWLYPLDAGPDAQTDLMLLGMDGSLRKVHSMSVSFPLPKFVGWVEQE